MKTVISQPRPMVVRRRQTGVSLVQGLPPVTVQVPRCTQPLFPLVFCAYRNTFFAPEYPGRKPSDSVMLNVFPDNDTDDVPAFKLHWLFCVVPAVPSVSGECDTPVSSSR